MSNRTKYTPERSYAVGIFEDEAVLLDAIRKLRAEAFLVHEVYSPYPVHGIDDALGYRRSRLPIVAFFFGFLGLVLALSMQIGMMSVDWPMIIGGKDFLPLPVFIPVTFELTVLFAAFGMVGIFFVISNLTPWNKPRLFDLRCTDDKHAVVLSLAVQPNKTDDQVADALGKVGASEIKWENDR